MGKSVILTIRNFKKFKGRGDVVHNTWFRLSNRLLEDPDFFDFSSGELLAWIYMLSLSSQKNSDVIEVNFAHAERVCRIKKKDLLSAIEKLKGKQIDPGDVTSTLRERDGSDTATGATLHDITEQDTTEYSEPPQKKNLLDLALGENGDRLVSQPLFENWVSTYGQDWVEFQLKQARSWFLANPVKRPKKDLARFLTNWLSNGWEKHRKTLPPETGNSSAPKPAANDPLTLANKLIQACQKCPEGDRDALFNFLGERDFKTFVKVTRRRIADTPANDFGRRDLGKFALSVQADLEGQTELAI